MIDALLRMIGLCRLRELDKERRVVAHLDLLRNDDLATIQCWVRVAADRRREVDELIAEKARLKERLEAYQGCITMEEHRKAVNAAKAVAKMQGYRERGA